MRLFLDAHTLLWAVDSPARLSTCAAAALRDPSIELLIGAGTIWELAIKTGLQKLTLSAPFRPWAEKAILDLGLQVIQITVEHADIQARLPTHHRDPFDRLLISQSQVENAPIVSTDAVFDQYGVQRLW